MKQSPLRIILLVAFVDLISFGLIIPLQASYADRLDAKGVTFGLLVGVYAAMQLVFNPILGRWSDRVGRRRVLLISLAGSVVSHALLGVADLAASLPLLFAARTLDGITGANVATAQAYIADVTTAENRAKGMGLFGAAFGLGFVVGPALGAGLAYIGRHVSGEQYGTAWPAFGATVITAIALVLVWRYLPEPERHVSKDETRGGPLTMGRLRSAMGHPRYRELFTVLFATTFAFVLLEATFVYLCAHRFQMTEMGTGLLFTYIGIIMVIVQGGLVGRLVPRFGETKLLMIAPFLTAIGFLLLSGVPGTAEQGSAWLLLLFGCIWMGLGHGMTGPNLNALISRQASAGQQGMTLGLSQGIGSLARAVGPPIGGLLYDLGPPWPYRVGAVFLIGIGIFLIRIRPAQERAIASSLKATK